MIQKPTIEKKVYARIMDVYRRRRIHIPFLNGLIRATLVAKAKLEVRNIQRRGSREADQIRQWYRNHKFFFGFAVPRSGTTFLANFLNRVVEQDIVQHEANINDYYYQTLAISSEAAAINYIKDYRLYEIYYRLHPYAFRICGEINPYLRRHCKALMRFLPEAKMFHLIRDGRDVLRSMMSRELFAANDPIGPLIRPAAEDPFEAEWDSMPRFEKLCWLWQEDNRFMREAIGHTVKFEMLLTDYDYFHAHLVEHVGLSVNQEDWEAHVPQVLNQTPTYRMPSFDGWQPDERRAFDRICGAEMATNGYSI